MDNDDYASREDLTLAHLDLARQEARRLGTSDEWLSESYLALVEAAASWDPERGVPFSAWARQLIRYRSRRRVAQRRVVAIPGRLRSQIASLVDDLERAGKDLESRSAVRHDAALLAALRVLHIAPLEDHDVAHQTEPSRHSAPEGLSWALQLRYGFDGGGLRSAREVSVITGTAVVQILREDAAYIRAIRAR
jgi:hypothetical protein